MTYDYEAYMKNQKRDVKKCKIVSSLLIFATTLMVGAVGSYYRELGYREAVRDGDVIAYKLGYFDNLLDYCLNLVEQRKKKNLNIKYSVYL